MAAKKGIIAVLMFHYRSDQLGVPVTVDSGYDEVMGRVRNRWFNSYSAPINCSYSIGPYPNVCLNVEDDFTCMFLHIKTYKPPSVDISVIFNEIAQNVVNEQSNGNSSSSRPINVKGGQKQSGSSLGLQFDEEIMPEFDVCPREAVNPLLSDGWANNIRCIGQKFLGGAVEFRIELAKFAAKCGFAYEFSKNNKQGVGVYCKERDISGCKWKICGTEKSIQGVQGVFVINSGELVHGCFNNMVAASTDRLTPKMISSMVMQNVKQMPTIGGKSVQDMMKGNFGIYLPYGKAWRSLQCARDKLFGVYRASFNELQWYGEAAKKTNPGTVFDIKCHPETKCFTRCFISFKASLDGFRHCRPMLFIDATSLKGKFKGQLLTAIGKDGNNGLFPVAFAIVDAETTDHWTYFISMLTTHVTHERKIFYLSDRHAGIMNAFPAVDEETVHFFCIVHLYTNLKGRYNSSWSHLFRRKMVGLLKKCAYAPTKSLFRECVAEFKEFGGPQAVAFLDNLPPNRWAVSHAPNIVRYGEMTSNAAESFNKVVLQIRSLPLKVMLDAIRQHIMGWYAERRADCSKWTGGLCPVKEHVWNASKYASMTWTVLDGGASGVFEVLADTTQTVDLNRRRCTCFGWQLNGFPCVHAVRVISEKRPNINTIIDPCFFSATFKLAYSHDLNPIPTSLRGESVRMLGDVDIIKAPGTKPTAGRPKRKRIPSYGEVPYKKKKPFTCPNCNKQGRHDIITCAEMVSADVEKLHQQFNHDEPFDTDIDV